VIRRPSLAELDNAEDQARLATWREWDRKSSKAIARGDAPELPEVEPFELLIPCTIPEGPDGPACIPVTVELRVRGASSSYTAHVDHTRRGMIRALRPGRELAQLARGIPLRVEVTAQNPDAAEDRDKVVRVAASKILRFDGA
jgi:hypothetical protein